MVGAVIIYCWQKIIVMGADCSCYKLIAYEVDTLTLT